MSDSPDQTLRSLYRIADFVFALLFFRAIEYLPSFQDGRWTELPHGLLSLLAGQPANLTRVIFGVLIVGYYWSRKNAFSVFIARSNAMIRANLTRPELKASAEQFTRTDLSNPLSAVIAAALSWTGLTIWTPRWFILMPVFSMLLARGRPANSAAG